MWRRIAGLLIPLAVLAPASLVSGSPPAWYDVDSASKLVVKVLDQGAEPRAPLRWKHVKGRSEQATVTVEELAEPTAGDRREEKAVASISLRADDVTRSGETRCVCTYDQFEWTSNAPNVSDTKDAWSTWGGTSRTLTLTSQGILKKQELALAKLPKQPLALLLALVALGTVRPPPFPAEAVGLGARWQVIGNSSAAWNIDETTVCTLKARDGDRLTIDVSLTRTAKPQKRPPKDGDVSALLACSATGSGTFELDLAYVLPTRGSTTVIEERREELRMVKKKFNVPYDTKSTWKLTLTSAGPATTGR